MKKAIIFGAGKFGSEAVEWLPKSYEILCYTDNNDKIVGTTVNGLPVHNPDYILDYPDCDVIIAVAFPAAIVEQLEHMNAKNKIYLYCAYFKPNISLLEVENYDYTQVWSNFCYQNSPVYNKDVDGFLERMGEGNCLYTVVAPEAISKFANVTRTQGEVKLLEIGCGSGQFAKLLFKSGYNNYTGVDISKEAIAFAKNINAQHKDNFFVGDAVDFIRRADYDLVIMLEVLEHLKDDMKLFEAMKPGKYCCCSVPNFASYNHYRIFDGLDSMKARYGEFVDVLDYSEIDCSAGTKQFFFVGKRK